MAYAATSAASASMVPCLLTNPPIGGLTGVFFDDSRTDELLARLGFSSSSAGTVVFWMSLGLVVLDVINSTTWAYSLSQLWRATSNRSARFRGFGTSILRSKSRACGVTYSGNVRGVLTMYL